MKFFNPQEDVLDIQLTQIGKRNLARGNFKPTYYSFFDTDILYDAGYASVDEVQNKSVPRIIDNTPRLKTQYLFEGAESNFRKLREQQILGKKINNNAMDRSLDLSPLGTSTGNEYLPAWQISLAEGKIENVALYHTASWGVTFTPQLSSSINVRTRVEYDESRAVLPGEGVSDPNFEPGRPLNDPDGTAGTLSLDTVPDIYPDGSYLVTEQPSLLLNVVELNNMFDNENFDIEVFEIITEKMGSEVKEILRPLKFITDESYSKKSGNIVSEEVLIPDPGHVGHYIDIFVDGEIDDTIMYKFTGQSSTANTHLTPPDGAILPYNQEDTSNIDPDSYKEPC